MAKYITLDTTICIADYAADEHPYGKNPAKPEALSEYNRGWNAEPFAASGRISTW